MGLHVNTTVLVALFACATAGCTKDAVSRGRDAAAREIADGRPCWWVIGGPARDGETLNMETGLPERSIGCNPAEAAYRDAHNEAIREARAAGRLKGMTLESKVTTCKAVAARFANESGTTLRIGDPPAQTPDGRFRVEIALRDPAEPSPSAWLFLMSAGSNQREALTPLGAPTARVLFGDNGTTLVVRDDKYGRYSTFDLAWPAQMQVFRDSDQPR